MKYSAYAECEIIHFVNCEISHFVRCEMKFAHIRVSEYFTFVEQIFHSEAISLARRANFVEKKYTSVSVDKCVLFFCLKRVKRCLNRGKNEQKVSGYDYLFKMLLILSSNDGFFFMLFLQIRSESSGVPLSRYEKNAKSKFSIGITPSKAKP